MNIEPNTKQAVSPMWSVHQWFGAAGRSTSPSKGRQRPVGNFLLCIEIAASGSLPQFADAPFQRAAVIVEMEGPGKMEVRAPFWQGFGDSASAPVRPEAEEGWIEDFLATIYALASVQDIEHATDSIFGNFDRLMSDGEWRICDDILRQVEVERLPTTLMRSLLTITAPAKNKLGYRAFLYIEIEEKMKAIKGEQLTERLIGRLA